MVQAMDGHTSASRAATALARAELPLALFAAALVFAAGASAGRVASLVGPALAVLLALLWLAGWVMGKERPGIPPLTAPVALFLLSAAVGVGTSYQPAEAWQIWAMILCGTGLFWAMARSTTPTYLYAAMAFMALLACGVAIGFLASDPWGTYEVKMPLLATIGARLAALLPQRAATTMNPNWAGGIVAALLPWFVPLALLGRRAQGAKPRRVRGLFVVIWLLGATIAILGLVLSASRGAWAATLTAGVGWAAWRALGKHRWRRRLWAWGAVVAAIMVGMVGLVSAIWTWRWPGVDTLISHWEIYGFLPTLMRDYLYTGAGLASFEMQFSTYALLIPVGYVTYGHAMLLDMLIAQGILGLVGYLCAVIGSLILAGRLLRTPQGPLAPMVEAAVASLAITLVHGLVDNVLYQERGLLLLWVPMALLAAHQRMAEPLMPPTGAIAARRGGRLALLAAGVALAAILGLSWRAVLGGVYANLGAVAQSQVELATYDPNADPWRSLDEIRTEEDLSRASEQYRRALAYAPGQITAHQRLAALALARGEGDLARQHMELVWAAGHHDPTTRLILGDALVAAGDVSAAAAVIDGQPRAVYRLLDQAWSRYWEAGRWAQARDAWETVVLLEPQNQHAAYWAAEAQRQMTRE